MERHSVAEVSIGGGVMGGCSQRPGTENEELGHVSFCYSVTVIAMAVAGTSSILSRNREG